MEDEGDVESQRKAFVPEVQKLLDIKSDWIATALAADHVKTFNEMSDQFRKCNSNDSERDRECE